MIDLQGRAALVTGGSRGIGAATCRMLAQAGADVAIHYASSAQAAQRTAAEVEGHGRRALVLRADLRDPAQAASLPGAVGDAWGRLDILVNNAGVWTHAPLAQLTPAVWDETMRVNLEAVYRITRASIELLQQSQTATIINVASTAAQRGEAEHAHYAASKAALLGWTKSLAVELGPRVRVNAVAPGWVETEMTAEALADPEHLETILHEIPRRRLGAPEDVAGAILFLASELSAHITGEVLNVNGGSVRCG